MRSAPWPEHGIEGTQLGPNKNGGRLMPFATGATWAICAAATAGVIVPPVSLARGDLGGRRRGAAR